MTVSQCWSFVGPEPTLFGKPKYCCMRLHYKNGEISGYFHTLRAVTRNPEDDGKGLCWDTMICCGTSSASVLRNSVNDIMG